jgi:hypothetical protein
MRQVKPSDVLSTKQMSQIDGSPSESVLKVYRTARVNNGQAPNHIKIGGRVFYHREDVERWLKENNKSDHWLS